MPAVFPQIPEQQHKKKTKENINWTKLNMPKEEISRLNK